MLNINSLALDKLKYMNLKGPQFETVSYFCYNYFCFDPNSAGMDYFLKSFEKWQKDNRRSIKQTLWKMFQSYNMWNSDELLDFEGEDQNSYFKQILDYDDNLINFCSKLDKIDRDELDKHMTKAGELLTDKYNLFISKFKLLKKNQDLFVSYPKFKQINHFNENFESLKNNPNFSINKYKLKVDSVNKNNVIYLHQPNYQNNFYDQNEVDVFGCFNNVEFIQIRYLSLILCYSLKNKELFEKFHNAYNDLVSVAYNDNNQNKIHVTSLENYQFFGKLDFILQILFNLYSALGKNNNTISSNVELLVKSSFYKI